MSRDIAIKMQKDEYDQKIMRSIVELVVAAVIVIGVLTLAHSRGVINEHIMWGCMYAAVGLLVIKTVLTIDKACCDYYQQTNSQLFCWGRVPVENNI